MSGIKPITNSVTLVQLVNFCKVVECRHFTETARSLYITQPTLSASIKSLEAALGVSLVLRDNKRQVEITQQGEELAEIIAPHLMSIIEAVEATSNYGKLGNRTLKIGTIPTIQGDYIPAFLRAYYEECGYASRVTIEVGFTDYLIRGLKRHEYDVVFCSYVPEERELAFIPIMTTSLVAVVGKEGPYADMEELDLLDLQSIPYVTYGKEAPIGREVKQLLSDLEVASQPITTFGDEFSLAGCVMTQPDLVGIMTDTYEIDSFRDRVNVIPIKGIKKDWHQICCVYDQLLLQDKTVQSVLDMVSKGICF